MKLATIEQITSIRPIEKADAIELATIGGWQSVVGKGSYKAGEKIIFIHPDTVLAPAPWNQFLVIKDNPEAPIVLRPRTLRGTFSAGLVMPINLLPDTAPKEIGTEVSSYIGVTKYEKPLPGVLAEHCDGYLDISVAPTTDQENGLSDLTLAHEVLKGDVTITGKLDGTSTTVEVHEGVVTKVYSRRVSYKKDPEQMYWKVPSTWKIPKTFTGVIQGELCGPGIQKNHLGLKDRQLFVFNVSRGFAANFTEKDNEWMNYDSMYDFCEEIGADIVPILDQGVFSLEELQKMCEEYKYDNGTKGEGIVVTNIKYKRFGHTRPKGFKLIANEYL